MDLPFPPIWVCLSRAFCSLGALAFPPLRPQLYHNPRWLPKNHPGSEGREVMSIPTTERGKPAIQTLCHPGIEHFVNKRRENNV